MYTISTRFTHYVPLLVVLQIQKLHSQNTPEIITQKDMFLTYKVSQLIKVHHVVLSNIIQCLCSYSPGKKVPLGEGNTKNTCSC